MYMLIWIPMYMLIYLPRLQLKHGSYEANPPFVPSIMEAAARRISELLEAAEAAAGALSFTVIVPGW